MHFVCGCFCAVIYWEHSNATKASEQASIYKEKYEKTVIRHDSAYKELMSMNKYKTVAAAMQVRDNATKGMPFKIGDVVYTKTDSSRVVVKDIVMGGTTYGYYVKYRIAYSGGNTEEIYPELLYKK